MEWLRTDGTINTLRPRQNCCHFVDDISDTFSWLKMYEFCLRFHLSLFLRFKLTIFHHWFRYWLGSWSVPSHYLNQWWLVFWHIYVSLCLNELKIWCIKMIRVLIHWNLQAFTMANILPISFWNTFLGFLSSSNFDSNIIQENPVGNEQTLIEVMVSHWTSDKSLSYPGDYAVFLCIIRLNELTHWPLGDLDVI